MRSFRVEKLTLEQVRSAYPEQIANTFPANELKPLKVIERALQRDEYVCCGAMDGDEALGVAFFVRVGGLMLVDYLAVKRELRSNGIGGRFLRALIDDTFRDAGTVLLETDEPSAADDPGERRIRERRLAFYLRNGLHDTGVLAVVLGVTYRLLTLPVGAPITPDEARRAYSRLYHAILPPQIYRERVFIQGLDETEA